MSVEYSIVVREVPVDMMRQVASTEVLREGTGFWVSTVVLGRRCFETLVFPAPKTDLGSGQVAQDPDMAYFNITNMKTRWEAVINHHEAVQAAVEVLQPHW